MACKLLICDDDPDIRVVVSSLFCDQYEVLTASDGEEAFEVIRRERPDIMLLDMALPSMSGLQILRRATQLAPRLIVIVLTGEQALESAEEALKLGAVEYITKPFEPHELKAELKRILEKLTEGRLGEAESPPWRVEE